eukprot:scaffold2205_cov183-Ochromonas_danica.AAC.6
MQLKCHEVYPPVILTVFKWFTIVIANNTACIGMNHSIEGWQFEDIRSPSLLADRSYCTCIAHPLVSVKSIHHRCLQNDIEYRLTFQLHELSGCVIYREG